jgi:hypothetical protein
MFLATVRRSLDRPEQIAIIFDEQALFVHLRFETEQLSIARYKVFIIIRQTREKLTRNFQTI